VRRTSRRKHPAGIAVVFLLVIASTLAVVATHPSLPSPGPASSTLAVGDAARLAPVGGSSAVPATPSFPPSAPTVESLFPNYNGSLPGDFPSTVEDWQVGTPAIVPASNTLWLPELAVTTHGAPAPPSAPALVYNLTTNVFERMVPAINNASALAFDPENGYLYATEPRSDSVEVYDPSTQTVIRAGIHVGDRPEAVAYDPTTKYVYVANSGSNNVTVIYAVTNQVYFAGIAVGTSPVALAVDAYQGWVYVANQNSSIISIITAASPLSPVQTTVLTSGPAVSLAFSNASDLLAEASPASQYSVIIDTDDNGVKYSPVPVGNGCSTVVVSQNESQFFFANASGNDVRVVSAISGRGHEQLTVGDEPTQMAIDAETGSILTWSSANRNLYVSDGTNNSTVAVSPSLDVSPDLIAENATSQTLYIGSDSSPGVSVVNATSGATLLPPIPVPGSITGLASDGGTGQLYVGYYGGVVAINESTGVVDHRDALLTGANGPLVVDPKDGVLWDGRGTLRDEVALNLSTLLPTGAIARLPVNPSAPESMILLSKLSLVVAVNSSSGEVQAFDSATGKVTGSPIRAGANLTSLTYDPLDGLIYAGGSDLEAIDPASWTTVGPTLDLSSHSAETGLAYDPSTGSVYLATAAPSTGRGTITVVAGAADLGLGGPTLTFSDGLTPGDLIVGGSGPGALNDSDFLLSANTGSGTIGLIGAPPTIASFSFSPPSIDVGASSNATLVVSGGVGASTVSYTGLPSGCPAVPGFNLSCTPTEVGTRVVTATVTDAIGETASATAVLSVGSAIDLTASFDAAPPLEVDVNQTFAASAGVSGGTPPYNLTWTFGDGTELTGDDVTHNYSQAGAYPLVVTAIDGAGGIAERSTSVGVFPQPKVSPYAYPRAETDAELPLLLNATISGGVPGGSGSWSFGPGDEASGIAVYHTWVKSGGYYANFSYEDGAGEWANGSVYVEVKPPVSGILSVDSASSRPVPGTPIDFSSTISGGLGPYTVVWALGSDSYATGGNVTSTFSAPGEYTVDVSVTDSLGGGWSSSVVVTVYPAPSSSPSLFSGEFGPGLAVGLFVGVAVAALILFTVERTRRRTLPAPPSPYVPPPTGGPGKRT